MKTSPLPWIVGDCGCILDDHGNTVCHSFVICDEMRDNRTFISEASVVLHETGLTPRQLAEQRAELLEALKSLLAAHDCSAGDTGDDADVGPVLDIDAIVEKARAAIAKAEGKEGN